MDELIRYYESTDEERRLFGGSGMLELERSKEIIGRYLSEPVRVVDVGGGPGVYAGWLASLGHEVHLLDPVEKHLAQAGRYPLASLTKGDARRLPWEDACLSPQDNDRKVETLSLFQVRQPITKSSVKGWKRFFRRKT